MSVSATPLALFRIAYAAVMLVTVAELWAWAPLFAPVTVLPVVGVVSSWIVMIPWLLALGGVLVGYQSRLCAAINLALAIQILGVHQAKHFQTADGLLLTEAWLVLLFPVDRALSVRQWRGVIPATIPTLFGLFLACIYLDTGVRKLFSPMWRAGLGVWAPASLPNLMVARVPFLDVPGMMYAAGYAVIAFECSFWVWVTLRRTRPAIVAAGLALHLGIAVYYPFPVFGLAMAVLYLPLLPAAGFVTSAASADIATRRLVVACASVLIVSATLIATDMMPARAAVVRARAFVNASFPITGFSGHGVFADVLFAPQSFQFDFVADTPDGPVPLPPTARSGFYDLRGADRAWEFFWKVASFPTNRESYAIANLLRWTRAALVRQRLPADTPVTLYARPQHVRLDQWGPGMLDANLAAPWEPIATLTGTILAWHSGHTMTEQSIATVVARELHHQPASAQAMTVQAK